MGFDEYDDICNSNSEDSGREVQPKQTPPAIGCLFGGVLLGAGHKELLHPASLAKVKLSDFVDRRKENLAARGAESRFFSDRTRNPLTFFRRK